MRIQGLSTVPLETHCVVVDVLYVGGFENVTLIVIMCGVAAEAYMITNGLYVEGLCGGGVLCSWMIGVGLCCCWVEMDEVMGSSVGEPG